MENIDSHFLDFERPISNLKARIADLNNLMESDKVNLSDDVRKLEEKLKLETKKIYQKLNDWQISQIARHPLRPHSSDYIKYILNDFTQLSGDRWYADDTAIIGGLARIGNQSVVFIGQQKGRETKEKIHHNFGMPRPEGYRKALRLMKLAEQFSIPIISFVDTPGAYPGIGAEQRNQSEAIARNLLEMSKIKVPTISIVIGEGGSGGALALAVSDKVLMLEYSIYSVISPEGCSSILWKDALHVETAAKNLALTSKRLHSLGIIDDIIKEPLGGAHNNPEQMSEQIKFKILDELKELLKLDVNKLVKNRQDKFLNIGVYSSKS